MAWIPPTVAEFRCAARAGSRWRKWIWLRWRHEERTIVAVDAKQQLVGFTTDSNLHMHWTPANAWGRWIAGATLVYSPPEPRSRPRGGYGLVVKESQNLHLLTSAEFVEALRNMKPHGVPLAQIERNTRTGGVFQIGGILKREDGPDATH